MRSTRVMGLLPCAGKGTRMPGLSGPKELLPIPVGGSTTPLCHLSLRAMALVPVDGCVVVVSPEKQAAFQSLQDLVDFPLTFVIQPQPLGLPHAIHCASSTLDNCDVVLALPDTVFLPPDALKTLHHRRRSLAADLLLGVFPVDEPERLGPVEFSADGTVLKILDKPQSTRVKNTWGVVSWSARFTRFCAEWEQRHHDGPERALGHVMETVRAEGSDVRAEYFPEGTFVDAGTPRGFEDALAVLRREGKL